MLIVRLLGVFAAIMLLPPTAAPAREKYYFSAQGDRDAHALTYATVRIFAAEKGGEQLGSGFVIDSKQGLILTALHVIDPIQDGNAWVAFPEETDRHRAKVVVPKSPADPKNG